MYIFAKNKPVFPHICTQVKASAEAQDFSSPYDRLAAEIVIAAIQDWRDLVKNKAWLDRNVVKKEHTVVSFGEIRAFFRSEYCEFIMMNFPIAPEGILELLERELQEAMEKDNWKEDTV